MAKLDDVTPSCVLERLGRRARGSRLFGLAWGLNLGLLKAVRADVDRRIERVESQQKAAESCACQDAKRESA